jgi:hypothetical protein
VDVDEIDVELRTPEVVRVRILILSSIMRRLTLENAPPDSDGDSLADAFDEREWFRDQHLASQLTAREAAILDSPLGCLAPEVIVEVSWQGEALVALAWAIGASDLPPVDTTSDPRTILELVPRPWDAIKAWISDPKFVSESDAVRQRELVEIWHWRATTELLRREAFPAERLDYEAAIAEVVAEARTAGLLPALRDGDFPVRGRSIKEIPNTEVDQLVALTGQRLRALNWTCGFGKSWDDVPLDV